MAYNPFPTGLVSATQQRASTAGQRGFVSAPENSFYLGANGQPDPTKPIAPNTGTVFGVGMKPLYNMGTGSNPWPASTTAAPKTGTPTATPPGSPAPSSANPFTTISNTKNPDVSNAIKGALGDLSTVTDANRKSLSDYVTQAGVTQQKNQAQTDAQTSKLADLYNGNTAAQQKQLTDNFGTTSQAAANLAMARASADAAARGMAGGSTGAGSYYAAQLAKQNQEAAVPIAQEVARQRINDLNQLTNWQNQNTGRAQSLNTAQQQSLLLPNEARNAFVTGQTSALAPISGLDLANTFYGLKGPQTPAYNLPYTSAPIPNGGGVSFPRYTPTMGTGSTAASSPALSSAIQSLTGAPGSAMGSARFSGPVNPQVANAYMRLTGQDPRTDPNFNSSAYQQALAMAGQNTPVTYLDQNNPDMGGEEDFSTSPSADSSTTGSF